MPWVKLDDQFPDHPKVDGLTDGAFRLHVSGLCHAARYLTDGHIPKDRPSRLMANYRPKYLTELIKAGLWVKTEGGYLIHQFTEWNKSKAWWDEKRKKDAERLANWREKNGSSNDVRNGVTGEVTNDVSNTRPVPVPVPDGSLVQFPGQSSTATRAIDDDGLTRIKRATKGSDAHARRTAEFILAKAPDDVRNPTAYVLAAINEDPAAYRFKRGNPKKGEECPTHAGQWADACAGCAADRKASA